MFLDANFTHTFKSESKYRCCAIQHLQRGGNKQFTFFESFWYIVVTFSTVGFGGLSCLNF